MMGDDNSKYKLGHVPYGEAIISFFCFSLFIYAKANMTATSIKETVHRQFIVRWSHSILTLGLMREKNGLGKVLAFLHNGDLITSLPLET